MEAASRDIVALICRSLEFPSDKLCGDISRVLKPGGTVLLCLSSQSGSKVSELSLRTCFFLWRICVDSQLSFPSVLQASSTHERKLLLAGFSDAESSEDGRSIVVSISPICLTSCFLSFSAWSSLQCYFPYFKFDNSSLINKEVFLRFVTAMSWH